MGWTVCSSSLADLCASALHNKNRPRQMRTPHSARSTSCDLATQGSSRCSSGNLIAARQANLAARLRLGICGRFLLYTAAWHIIWRESLHPTATQQFLKSSNNHAPTTTQPSFVSNPRTIPTQPSHIRYSPTTFQPRGKGFVRRWPKAPPHGASANTPYPFARTFAPPPHCRRVHNTLSTLQDAIRLYSDHYNPLQAKCNLIRGKLRRARSNAPQRFEASS